MMKDESKLRLKKKLREEASFSFSGECYYIDLKTANKIIDKFETRSD